MSIPSLHRILVIDDEHEVRTMAKLVLEKIGNFSVEISSSGSEALDLITKFNPDLILLDVMMPGMDGPGVLKVLRAQRETATIPVIFLTAKVQQQEIEQYKKLGALDVIPKPFDPMTLSSSITGIWGLHHRLMNPTVDLLEQLKILRSTYAEQVPGKVEHIKEKWRTLHDDDVGKETLKSLHRFTHSLAGSCGTFGFSSLRESAYGLEILFNDIVKNDLPPSYEQRVQIDKLLHDLTLAAETPPPGELPNETEDIQPASPEIAPEAGKLVFLAGSDSALAQELTLQLGYFGYNVQSIEYLAGLEEAVKSAVPAAIIMDTKLVEGQFNGAGTIAKIQHGRAAALPVLFISGKTDVDTRLRAVHAGGQAYFTKPVDINELVDKLDALISDQIHEGYRVLIIEDEPNLAKHYALTLEQAGMTTAVAVWAREVSQALVDFKPDLVLMDLYLPDYNGIDMAGMIRQQETHVSIPIIFLSGETDLDKQLQAMHIGADGFFTKPIDPRYLISMVTACMQRARALRALMVNDSLTGLINHACVKERLDIEIARAKRNGEPLTCTMVDIDHFKSVNDTYGHLNGDRILKALARLFRQRLRRTDIVGRYGGKSSR